MSEEYYNHINNGQKYICDAYKCTVELGEHEYNNYITESMRLCESHWNYFRLKQGSCPKCKVKLKIRNEMGEYVIDCDCGSKIYMRFES